MMSEVARKNMVNCQIRPNKVTDHGVLDAFGAVPREQFVLKSQKGYAYIDQSLNTQPGRCVIEGTVLARLLQAANIQAGDKVLVVGADLGYTVAICLHLTPHVVGVDTDAGLLKVAEANLDSVGLKALHLHVAPIQEGYETFAPYDVILMNGSTDVIPTGLFDQLSQHGGRLLTIMNEVSSTGVEVGRATIFTKTGHQIDSDILFEGKVPVLPEYVKAKKFDF